VTVGYIVLQWNQDHWQTVSGSFCAKREDAEDYLERWKKHDQIVEEYVVAEVVVSKSDTKASS
jgi:hypothetical protein